MYFFFNFKLENYFFKFLNFFLLKIINKITHFLVNSIVSYGSFGGDHSGECDFPSTSRKESQSSAREDTNPSGVSDNELEKYFF